jgi:tetratricopeptide (TPR) repeat protein
MKTEKTTGNRRTNNQASDETGERARKQKFHPGMMEKYLHSYGDALLNEGRFQEAEKYLRRALAISDEPYAHSDLSKVLAGMKRYEEAVAEITKAIRLRPSLPDYYHARAGLHDVMGDVDKARLDYAAAIELDENYLRINEIRSAAALLNERHGGNLFLETSCPVTQCPAYCCHFTMDTLCHGLSMGPWKLHLTRKFLSEEGLAETDFLDRLPADGQKHLHRLFSPDLFIREKGQAFIFYPQRVKPPIDSDLLKTLPKGREYNSLLWIDEKARPCVFLKKGTCMIYHIGEDASLPACRQFLCLTGFIFLLLVRFYHLDNGRLSGRSMAQINRLTLEILFILARNSESQEAKLREILSDPTLARKEAEDA